MPAYEINFDGLVGPTHNFAGLSTGNLASIANRGRVSDPRKAALQGLAKMRTLMDLGLLQGVLPPHERPHVPTLRRLGFTGTDRQVVESAWKADPILLANVSSASAMWTANAATVSPSCDTRDGRVHMTPSNLGTMFHRSLEAEPTSRILKTIFADPDRFVHHQPLPGSGRFGDEGAANHSRLCAAHGEPGVEMFVYGRSAFEHDAAPRRFEPRQAREVCESIIRLHALEPSRTVLLPQAAIAVNAGAFHNDVVAVANGPVMLAHEHAFEGGQAAWDTLRRACRFEVTLIQVPDAEVPLADAIRSYLFNSQLVTLPGVAPTMALILPEEARENARTFEYLRRLIAADNPIRKLVFTDVRESMSNGGGPACLRLRIVLDDTERAALKGSVVVNPTRLSALESWVARHYRYRLSCDDLGDPQLLDESRTALDELTTILGLGSIYDFQAVPGGHHSRLEHLA